MTDHEWATVEGMIITPDVDPADIAEHLRAEQVLAQIEWFPATPSLVGIRVVSDGESVGLLGPDTVQLLPGASLASFVESLAAQFSAEVMLGDQGIDRLPAGFEVPTPAELKDSALTRVVEIGPTPASAVPILAAFEGVDISDIELAADSRVLLAEVPAGKPDGWYLGDLPAVILTAGEDGFQVSYLPRDDEDEEGLATYNWAMCEETITGGHAPDAAALELAHRLVGSRPDIEAIMAAVDGDADAGFQATLRRGDSVATQFVRAMGLPTEVAEFLRGQRTAEDVPGARSHQARGISNALGRTVDIMLDERTGGVSFWDTFSAMVRQRPWQVPLMSAVEVALGVSLLALTRPRGGTRTWTQWLGTSVGSALLADALAEQALVKYVTLREARRAERLG